MPLPAPLVGLTIRATIIAADSAPIEGALARLTPLVPATSPAGDVLLTTNPLDKTSGADGSVEWLNILATDSPGLSNRVPYQLTVTQSGRLLQPRYSVELLASQAVAGVLRLDDVTPASVPDPLVTYVQQASVGTIGGPAGPLDENGHLPADQLPGNGSPSTLTDATTINTNASLGHHFRCTLGGNRTLANPTNGADGQKVIWELIQDSTGSRTITLDSKFALGADIPSVILSTSPNKRDFLGAIYHAADDHWFVIALAKGY